MAVNVFFWLSNEIFKTSQNAIVYIIWKQCAYKKLVIF